MQISITVPAPRAALRRRLRGFTLIEQIAVIAAVGATSAVALPQLVEVQAQAEATALASLAGAAGSAMVLNQAGCLLTDQRAVPGKCLHVQRCEQVSALLMTALPAGYRIAQNGIVSTGTCSVVQLSTGQSAGFYSAGTGL